MLLIVEPFYGGSHRQMVDTLVEQLSLNDTNCRVVTMSAKKWQWRARTAALHLSRAIPEPPPTAVYSLLLTSSVTPLAELLALRRDLAAPECRKVIYFHENQLAYPTRRGRCCCLAKDHCDAEQPGSARDGGDFDYQYGFNQILSALVADQVVFNSHYNRRSFLDRVDSFLRRQPDYKVSGVAASLEPKCSVLYFPLNVPLHVAKFCELSVGTGEPLHILWSHRWEHDKNPAMFFDILRSLQQQGELFRVSVIGQSFSEVPAEFDEARSCLEKHIAVWGFQNSREDYWRVLGACDCVVSTADHEFFGVAVLEAMSAGCWPLCPRKLVYPELLDEQQISSSAPGVDIVRRSPSVMDSDDARRDVPRDPMLYNTNAQLLKTLRRFCRRPQLVRCNRRFVQQLASRFHWSRLEEQYRALLRVDADMNATVSADVSCNDVVGLVKVRQGQPV